MPSHRSSPESGRGRPSRSLPSQAGLRPVAFVFLLWAAQGCGSEPEVEAVAEGRALYEANCAMCHGDEALGDGPMAGALPVPPPSVIDHLAHHTQAQLVRIIGSGIPPAMPPTPLGEDEIELIVDYVWTLVPEEEVAALRAMQEQMEAMGDSAMGPMPGSPGTTGMPGMPGMDHSGMDHSGMDSSTAPMDMNGAGPGSR